MSEIPSEADVLAARATIKWYRDYPDDLWNQLPAEIALKHTEKMDDSRRIIQAYEKHHGLRPTL